MIIDIFYNINIRAWLSAHHRYICVYVVFYDAVKYAWGHFNHEVDGYC